MISASTRAFVFAAAIGAAATTAAGCSVGAPVLTERDSLLVADFPNTTGDAAFDDVVKPAVATLLQQSPYFTIVPDQRVQRLLRAMQTPADEPVTGEVGREACKRAGARAIVDGSVAAAGSDVVITLVLTDCQTAAVLAKEEVHSAKAGALAQLGATVTKLRRRIGEPAATLQKYDAPIADAMTASVEAVQEYGRGLRARATRGDEAAVPFFRQAIARDANFGMAHAKLAVVTGNVGMVDESRDQTKQAWDLRGKMTAYERLYIEWNYAARVQQDQKAVKTTLEQLTTEYPRDFAARNNLGVYYNGTGQYEEALKQYRAASDIAPDEPGPISNAAYVLMTLERYDEASAEVDRALAIRPDPGLAAARWITAVIAGLPRAAEFETVTRGLATPEQMATTEASLAAWSGRFKAFEKMQDDFMARARASRNPDAAAIAATGRTMTLGVYRGGRDLDALKAAAAREKNPALLSQQLSALALLGETAAVRTALPRLVEAAKESPALAPALNIPRAYLQSVDGHPAEAIAALQAVLATTPRLRDLNYFIGDIQERSGDLAGAAASYRIVTGSVTFLGASPIIPWSRLKLARLLVKRGDQKGAAEQLDALLAQWKNADGEFAALSEVKKLRAQIR
jgi:eukaryotic-like serine/threonine-protein kinase